MLDILLWISLFISGYLIIFFAADLFIDNLKDLCVLYGVSPFIIGLIVLGIDPEESIASIVSAINGLSYLAIGNVIGNSILSLSLCFALPAFFYKIDLKKISRFYFLILYLCMAAIIFSFFIQFGLFVFGFIGIVIYFIYLFRSLKHISKKEEVDIINIKEVMEDIELEKENLIEASKQKKILFVSLGLILIIVGGELLIFSAEGIIQLTGISEAFFGFIIIAFITNVEELTLIFKSIKKKSIEIGLGGMIGKVIWNLSFTFGISGLFALNIEFNVVLILNWIILLVLIIYYQFKSMRKSLDKKDAIILFLFLIIFIIFNLIQI